MAFMMRVPTTTNPLAMMRVPANPLISVAEGHPIGSLFEINGQVIHAKCDTGWEDDITLPVTFGPKVAVTLRLSHVSG